MVTLGVRGCVGVDQNDEFFQVPSFSVPVIDTTGAGDIFHGAFVYGIASGLPYQEVIEISAMAAAVSVESRGSQSSIPDLQTVRERLKQL